MSANVKGYTMPSTGWRGVLGEKTSHLTFNQQWVEVPRCLACEHAHSIEKKMRSYSAWIVAVAVFLTGAILIWRSLQSTYMWDDGLVAGFRKLFAFIGFAGVVAGCFSWLAMKIAGRVWRVFYWRRRKSRRLAYKAPEVLAETERGWFAGRPGHLLRSSAQIRDKDVATKTMARSTRP